MTDILLRCAWTFTFSECLRAYPHFSCFLNTFCCCFGDESYSLFPTTANPYFHERLSDEKAAYFLAFVEVAELLRRAVWAIFRVEHAHVSRKDEFRSYEYVPLFYEHTTLTEQHTKANKPTSMILETVAIFLIVVVITVVIVLTSE